MSIKKRLKADTPSFFKKIGRVGVALVAIGGVISAPVLGIPIVIGATIIAVGTTAKIVSQLVVENPKDLQ